MDLQDWRVGKTMAERYVHMFDNQIGSDVSFHLGNNRKVVAHKFILVSRSAVFEAMFCGSLAEKTDNRIIKITDIEEDIFLAFLKFLYNSDIELTEQNTLPILYVARKYCVEELVQICADSLHAKMTPMTVCDIMEQAHTYDIDDLKDMCLQFIFENGNSVLQSPGFLELCSNCVQMVIQSNELFVEETDVYCAVTSWAEQECRRRNLEFDGSNKRLVLGKLLYDIRFPTMDRIYYTDVVANDDLLTEAEKIMIFQHMFGSTMNDDLPFSDVKREARVIRCMRFPKNHGGEITCEPGFKNSNFGIDLRASEDVMLQGIVLFGACGSSTASSQSDSDVRQAGSFIDQYIKITISAIPHQSETYTFEYDSVDVPFQRTYDLFLNEPVLLRKGRVYAVQVKLDLFLPYHTYGGVDGLSEVDSGSVKFNFLSHQSMIATTVEKGQIAGVLFSKLQDPEKSEAVPSPKGSPVRKEKGKREVKSGHF